MTPEEQGMAQWPVRGMMKSSTAMVVVAVRGAVAKGVNEDEDEEEDEEEEWELERWVWAFPGWVWPFFSKGYCGA